MKKQQKQNKIEEELEETRLSFNTLIELDQLSDILLEKMAQKYEINFQNGSQFVWFPKGLKKFIQSEKEK